MNEKITQEDADYLHQLMVKIAGKLWNYFVLVENDEKKKEDKTVKAVLMTNDKKYLNKFYKFMAEG